MVKRTQIFFILIALFLAHPLRAQLEKGELVDGIAAVVGDEIVLESDIDETINMARQQGATVDDRCAVLENMMQGKLILFHAKKDTLITLPTKQIEAQTEARYNQLLASFPSEEELLKAYKFRTPYEMKTAITKISKEQYYQSEEYRNLTTGVDVTPSEVTAFYEEYQSQLPDVNDEVKLARIVIYPTLTEAHKQELIDKLKAIKKDIESGKTTFSREAMIYSEDPGSASNGGLIENAMKGQMVRPFEAAALNLQEGQISEPVKTEYGYHLIELVSRAGKRYSVRHILLKAVPNEEEIATAEKKLDKIRQNILDGKISFKEAALKYSDDELTKFNAGVMTNAEGRDNLEKLSLDAVDAYQIAGLHKGDITQAFEVDFGEDQSKKKAVEIIRINDVIPAHKLSLQSDYERVREIALNNKKNKVVGKWIESEIHNTFISLDKRYQDCDFKSNWLKK